MSSRLPRIKLTDAKTQEVVSLTAPGIGRPITEVSDSKDVPTGPLLDDSKATVSDPFAFPSQLPASAFPNPRTLTRETHGSSAPRPSGIHARHRQDSSHSSRGGRDSRNPSNFSMFANSSKLKPPGSVEDGKGDARRRSRQSYSSSPSGSETDSYDSGSGSGSGSESGSDFDDHGLRGNGGSPGSLSPRGLPFGPGPDGSGSAAFMPPPQQFNPGAIPSISSGNVPFSSDIARRAFLMMKLERLENRLKKKFKISPEISTSDLETLIAKTEYMHSSQSYVKVFQRLLVFLTKLLEVAAPYVPYADLDLQGFSESVYLSIDTYDDELYDIYDQYHQTLQWNPLVRLPFKLFSSAIMYSITRKALNNPAISSLMSSPDIQRQLGAILGGQSVSSSSMEGDLKSTIGSLFGGSGGGGVGGDALSSAVSQIMSNPAFRSQLGSMVSGVATAGSMTQTPAASFIHSQSHTYTSPSVPSPTPSPSPSTSPSSIVGIMDMPTSQADLLSRFRETEAAAAAASSPLDPSPIRLPAIPEERSLPAGVVEGNGTLLPPPSSRKSIDMPAVTGTGRGTRGRGRRA